MRRYLLLIATLGVIAVNAAANILPINGVHTGELSARFPTGFTPAGWVFSIWGLIYLGLMIFAVYAAGRTPARRGSDPASRLHRIELPYLVSCAANAGWIFLWHYEQILGSLMVMLVLLGSLVLVYWRLRAMPAVSPSERLCMDAPFSLYLGWITTASLANLGVWFFAAAFYPFGLQRDEWAILTVVAATAIYVAIGTRTRDAIYTAVFAWASLGIVLQTLETARPVRLAAAAGCAATLLVTVLSVFRRSSDTAVRHL